jgi:hypothetical protein
MNTKDQWIQKSMESLDNINQAEVNPFLADKIMNRMSRREDTVYFSSKKIRRIAVAFIILLMINIVSIRKYRFQQATNHRSSASEYSFEFNYNY